jgi:uncharacterized damage-inducible protein DinB
MREAQIPNQQGERMKNRNILLMAMMLIAMSCPLLAQAPKAPATVTSVLDRSLSGMEGEFVPAAEAMPEEKYSFAPTTGEFKGVRTFSQQVKHVAAVNYLVAAGILGEKPPVDTGGENGPDSAKSKADIVKFLKDSFAYAHKAIATVNETNSVADIPSPFGEGKTTRLSMAVLLTGHGFDHYGQMVEYLRLNGIIPPASR